MLGDGSSTRARGPDPTTASRTFLHCKGAAAIATIRIVRPTRRWTVTPATVLPTALLVRLVRPQWNYTVLLDRHSAGKIGNDQVRVFHVAPGEHTLRLRFVQLRTSKEMRMSLSRDEERQFICGTSAFGWPTLRDASPEELARP